MEIDKAIKERDDRRLKIKYNNAIYVIRRVLALYSIAEVALSFNGGKDSTVLLHLLRPGWFLHKGEQSCSNGSLNYFPVGTIYFESSSAFPEINSFTYDTTKVFILQLEAYMTQFQMHYCVSETHPVAKQNLNLHIGFLMEDWSEQLRFGTFEDQLGPLLCKMLHSIGWKVKQTAVVQNDAPNEEFEEYLRHLIGEHCTGDKNEMALLPEGVTELLHYEELPIPLIKCQNIIILGASNISELEKEWNGLIELRCGGLSLMEPYTP
ncbi:uncharacterized protein LOC123202205 [Mangifera indica]|uniref:uncharacterized protein LOC123202205 n=1 Tax=Mangifera indica TaxID=29780 RepID=UPI001CFA3A57|nr:uncharacterized protein LOC123202205 [Mangifera indica]